MNDNDIKLLLAKLAMAVSALRAIACRNSDDRKIASTAIDNIEGLRDDNVIEPCKHCAAGIQRVKVYSSYRHNLEDGSEIVCADRLIAQIKDGDFI